MRATGVLYLDDGQTYDFEKGSFIWRRFDWTTQADGSHALRSIDESARRAAAATASSVSSVSSVSKGKNSFAESIADVRVERIVVLGLEKEPRSIRAGENGEPVQFSWSSGISAAGSKLSFTSSKASELVIKDPKVLIADDFVIEIK